MVSKPHSTSVPLENLSAIDAKCENDGAKNDVPSCVQYVRASTSLHLLERLSWMRNLSGTFAREYESLSRGHAGTNITITCGGGGRYYAGQR